MGNLYCAREHSVQFFMQFFYTVKLHSLTSSVWGPLRDSTQTVRVSCILLSIRRYVPTFRSSVMDPSSKSSILNPCWPPLDAETHRLHTTTALAVRRLARLVSGGTICSRPTERNGLIYILSKALQYSCCYVTLVESYHLKASCWNVCVDVYRQWLLLFAHSTKPKGPIFNECTIHCKCGGDTCIRKPLWRIGEDQINLIALFWCDAV